MCIRDSIIGYTLLSLTLTVSVLLIIIATPISPGQADTIREMLSVKTSVKGGFVLLLEVDLENNKKTKTMIQTKAIHKITRRFLLLFFILRFLNIIYYHDRP